MIGCVYRENNLFYSSLYLLGIPLLATSLDADARYLASDRVPQAPVGLDIPGCVSGGQRHLRDLNSQLTLHAVFLVFFTTVSSRPSLLANMHARWRRRKAIGQLTLRVHFRVIFVTVVHLVVLLCPGEHRSPVDKFLCGSCCPDFVLRA